MSQSVREGRAEVRALRLEKLHKAEHWYDIAIAQTQKVLDEYDFMPPSQGDRALQRALQFQNEMMDEYAEMFTQLMLEDDLPNNGVPVKRSKPRKRIRLKPLTKTAGSL